jgi:hypothetical protein
VNVALSLYEVERDGEAVIIFSGLGHYETSELYQWMVRHFGFYSEQFGWVPDFFHAEADSAIEPEIAAEHEWVLRGRGQGDGYPQHFKVMTRYLSKHWFEQIFGEGEQMAQQDAVASHNIMS